MVQPEVKSVPPQPHGLRIEGKGSPGENRMLLPKEREMDSGLTNNRYLLQITPNVLYLYHIRVYSPTRNKRSNQQ